MKKTGCLLAIIFCCNSHGAFAGKLEDFENDAHKPEYSYPYQPKKERKQNCDGFVDCMFIEPFFDAITDAAMDAMEVSISSLANRRQRLHNVYLTYDYQDVDKNVYADNLEFNLELTNIGFNCKASTFNESSPDDRLRLQRCHALFLWHRGRTFGIALGLGRYTLEGDLEKSGFTSSVPITFNFSPRLSFKMTYEQYDSIESFDAQFFLGRKLRLMGGYKSLFTDKLDLSGPYIGIAYKW